MKKTPDRLLKGGKLETKKPVRGKREIDKGKKSQAEKIRGGVRGKLGAVLQETAVQADVSKDAGKGKKKKSAAEDRQKKEPKKPAKRKHAKPEVPAGDTENIETVEDSEGAQAGQKGAGDIDGKPVDVPAVAAAPEAEAAQKQEFEKFARQLYTSEQITELEQLGIPLDVAGSYTFVIEKNPDGTLSKYRFWNPKLVKFFIDNKISAQRVKSFMYAIYRRYGNTDICTTNNIAAWAKHPELPIEILIQHPERFPAHQIEFYADYFKRRPEFTWVDILEYPGEFSPDDVAFLVCAGIKPDDSLQHVELFSTERRGADLFNAEQLEKLQQGIVPPEVKIAYNRGGFSYTDKAILYFAEHRAKPALVASYPKEFSAEDRVYCIENFVIAADIDRYPQWTQKYEPRETVKKVCFLVKHNADSALSRQVFEKYLEYRELPPTLWNELKELIEAKKPLDQVLKYLEKYNIPAEYIIMLINRGVSPETVHDYISKIARVKYVFICECVAAGMKADDAKPYWENGFGASAVADLWRGHIGADAAKSYHRLRYVNEYGRTCEYNASGAEIVRYLKKNVSPEVAALLRKADFTDDELSEAVAELQKKKANLKIFKILATVGAAVVGLTVAGGITYKACAGDDAEKEPLDRGRPAAAGPVEIRIPTSLCRFDFIPPKRVDLSCTTNYSVPIQIGNLVIDGRDKLGERTVMKAHATGVVYTDGITYDCENADFFMPANNSDRGQLLDPVYDHMVCEPQPTQK